ncbi:MAG: hypothetical protein WCF36_13600 [Candidatus Nanopelagicales bacterium]
MSDWHDTWVAELDRLELTLEQAESLLRANDPAGPDTPAQPPWAPQARGVLPDDLLPRARLVHERQLAVARSLAERALRTQRHNDLARVIRESTMAPEIPVYLDISA